MSLFGIKPVTESSTVSNAYSYVGETTELAEIMFEAAKDITQIQGGLYVADVMMESQVLFEGASEEVLLEGVVKDFFDKIIEAFRKLLEKIRSWFKKMYQAIQAFFLQGEKFIKKFSNELHQKDSTGYTFTGHRWNKKTVKDLFELADVTKAEVPKFSDVNNLFAAVHAETNSEGKVTSKEVKDAQDAFLHQFRKVDNVSELKKEILEEATNGDKEEIENFEVYSLTEMMDFVKSSSKFIDKLKKAEKTNEKSILNLIQGMENLKKGLSTEDKAKYSSSINNCAAIARYELSVANALVECAITVAKKQNSEFTGALKGLLRYKGTKEGFSYMDGSSKSGSLLESAMGLL